MKKTAFYDAHIKMGGRMVPFAGFDMPVEFSGIKNEHIHVRKKVGIFDVSHMGEIRVKGKYAFGFIQRMTTNDAQTLREGKVQYTCFPNGKGGIVDDLLLYMVDENEYLLVVNASNTEKDWEWLVANNKEGAELINESDATSQLAVQGPDAKKVLQKITDTDLEKLPYYSFSTGNVGGAKSVLISNTGYTGAGGYELYFRNEDAAPVLNALIQAGEEFDIQPAGLAARDTLRLEMGFCLYGNDIDETTSPIEAGLGWITKFVDGNDFLDREYLEKQKNEGVTRRLVGFELNERGIPRKGYPIYDLAGNEIGIVTSGTMSPITAKAIGMGYVEVPLNKTGTEIRIGIRNKQLGATVVRPPFYKPE
ncbi:glycine cleavage system aminomethyltransferase GcvT [Bacteroidota bacterium]